MLNSRHRVQVTINTAGMRTGLIAIHSRNSCYNFFLFNRLLEIVMSIKITIKSKDFEIQFDYKINVKVKRYLNISVYSPRLHTCSLSLTMTAHNNVWMVL